MSNWTSGYVADIDYTYGYYEELNPIRSRFALLNSGLVFPEYATACELGFGQGLSTNIHAAASNIEWWGTDFNPAQAGFARELESRSKSNAKLYDEAFEDFCNRTDLPDFDFISLHGIWSWVSGENRAIIVDFIRRKLKVGGIVYISYNTQPGWAAFAPMRHLMTQHAEVVGSSASGIISRVDGAIEFAEKLLETNPGYLKANPQVSDRIKKLKDQSRHYLAHEYFNRDWEPMHFSTMADWLGNAKLDFACSANYLDHLNPINMTPEQTTFLQEISDVMVRESVRDFMTNCQFRKDYWVRGLRKLSEFERGNAISEIRVVLSMKKAAKDMKVVGSLGEAKVNEEIYDPILELLSDFKIRSLGQIADEVRKETNISHTQLIECVLILIGTGHINAVQSPKEIAAARKKTDPLNEHLFNKSRSASEINFFASPVTGGGHALNFLQQLFILAVNKGRNNAEDIANFTWERLLSRGQKLVVAGKEIETAEDSIAELNRDAAVFLENELPAIKALQII